MASDHRAPEAVARSASSQRCAVHPARPAADTCPVCGRPRCDRDAAASSGGCLACAGTAVPAKEARARRAVPTDEGVIRAALAVLPISLLGGAISSEYVGTDVFGIVTPFLVGVACGAAAVAAAGAVPRPEGLRVVRLVGLLYALIATGYGFRFVVGGEDPFAPAGDRIWPYAAAAAGAWLWTIPPKRRSADGQGRAGRP